MSTDSRSARNTEFVTTTGEQSSRQDAHRPKLIVALGLLVSAAVVALGVVVWVRPWTSSATTRGGPLKAGGMDYVTSTMAVQKVGDPVIWAMTTFLNEGRNDVVIDAVTMMSNTPGVVTDVVVSATGPGVLGNYQGWPRGTLRRYGYAKPQGVMVPPRKYLGIAARLVPPRDAFFKAGPVVVSYHVGGHHYRVADHAYGGVCVRPGLKAGCPNFPLPS